MWEAMMFPYFVKVEVHHTYGVNGCASWEEVHTLPNVVYDIHDNIIAMCVWQLHDEVHADLVPPFTWCQHWILVRGRSVAHMSQCTRTFAATSNSMTQVLKDNCHLSLIW